MENWPNAGLSTPSAISESVATEGAPLPGGYRDAYNGYSSKTMGQSPAEKPVIYARWSAAAAAVSSMLLLRFAATGWLWWKASQSTSANVHSRLPAISVCVALVWLANFSARVGRSPSSRWVMAFCTELLLVVLGAVAVEMIPWQHRVAQELSGVGVFVCFVAVGLVDRATRGSMYSRSFEQ